MIPSEFDSANPFIAAFRVMMEVVLMAGKAYPPSWAALSIWRNWAGVAMGMEIPLLIELTE
jgi:hypothetical protein